MKFKESGLMKVFAVIGDPVAHSKSPRIHNSAIQALGLNAIYTRFHLTKASDLRGKIFELGLNGANITVPFKEEALKIADYKDEMALNIGSANTLLIKGQKIHAYNTDGIGFLRAIAEFRGIKSALILGAGGTAKALAFVLAKQGVRVSVANRSVGRFKDFAPYQTFLYENLAVNSYDLVINTTSAGLKDELLPCDEKLLKGLLSKAKYAFEVIYGKQTPFLKLAKECQTPCKDGASMLLWQGVFAFELFFELCSFENLSKSLTQPNAQNLHFQTTHLPTNQTHILNAMQNALNLAF